MAKVVRVAVVGYGGMGGWHTKRLQEIPGVVELAGVYDIKPERNKVAEENGIHAYSSFEELLADKTVDVVTVAIPERSAQEGLHSGYGSGQGCHQREAGHALHR